MKRNPFEKFLGPEDHLQMQVARYIKLQYPKVLFNHIPNEGKRTPFEKYRFAHFGIRAGFPDLMIYHVVSEVRKLKDWKSGKEAYAEQVKYAGLAIELKSTNPVTKKKSYPTANQKQVLKELEDAGWQCHVCWTFDEAKAIIDKYLTN